MRNEDSDLIYSYPETGNSFVNHFIAVFYVEEIDASSYGIMLNSLSTSLLTVKKLNEQKRITCAIENRSEKGI